MAEITTYYDSLSREVVIRVPVTMLGKREKMQLFLNLMDELGITDQLNHAEPDQTLTIINEAIKINW